MNSQEKLAFLAVEKFLPPRHAELRPSRKWLIFAVYLFVFAGFFLYAVGLLPRTDAAHIGAPIALGLASAGFVCIVGYFRYRIHARSYGLYIYRWGRRFARLPYASFVRAELGYWHALRLVRADGSFWNVPAAEDHETLAQLFWRLERAGLPIPDAVARRNRFGLETLEGGSLGVFRKVQPYR